MLRAVRYKSLLAKSLNHKRGAVCSSFSARVRKFSSLSFLSATWVLLSIGPLKILDTFPLGNTERRRAQRAILPFL